MTAPNVVPPEAALSHAERAKAFGHASAVLWLTGLSGSGKTTLGHALERRLVANRVHALSVDGDTLRTGVSRDLGFSVEARAENVRRAAYVAKLFADAGGIAIVTLISPLRAGRDEARAIAAPNAFIEVHVATPLAVCEQRDPKGLYKKARSGAIPEMTGIGSPYEEPLGPELRVDLSTGAIDDHARTVIELLALRGIVRSGT